MDLLGVAAIATIAWFLIRIGDRIKMPERVGAIRERLRFWYHRERVPTKCRLCHKREERRRRMQDLEDWILPGWEYHLARGRRVVRGATGEAYGPWPPRCAEIEHFRCKALRWLSRCISDSGSANNFLK